MDITDGHPFLCEWTRSGLHLTPLTGAFQKYWQAGKNVTLLMVKATHNKFTFSFLPPLLPFPNFKGEWEKGAGAELEGGTLEGEKTL